MIAFNLVGTKKNSGTKTFNINFLKEIIRFNSDEDILIYVPKFYLDSQNFNFSNKIIIKVKSNFFDNFIIRFFWMQFILPIELKIKNAKVLFSSSNYSPFILRFLNIQSVLYVHTVLPWFYLNLMPGNKLKNYFIKKIMEISISTSKLIIVPSSYAKTSLINKLKIKSNKIYIINLGIDHILIHDDNKDKIPNFDYDEKYILSVISCVKYHNILNLLKSYKDFINQTNYKIKFVLVLTILDKKYFDVLKNFVEENFNNNQIIFLSNLENKYLLNLYKNSSLYLFSSYSETFGLTSLEAMYFNIPLLLSRTSSIEEINGDIPEYFDPDNTTEIKNKLVKIIELKKDKLELESIKNKSSQHLKSYLWKDTYNKTYKVLKKFIT